MDIVNNVTPFSSEDTLVAELSESLALACGLSTDTAKLIGDAAALHDVGKNFICKSILNKPEKLTPDEYSIIKTHTLPISPCECIAGEASLDIIYSHIKDFWYR